jgi:hypothetical protein
VACTTECLEFAGILVAEVAVAVGVVDVQAASTTARLAVVAGAANGLDAYATPAVRSQDLLIVA